ncbi:hypothetical protein [Kitasatospora sp. NPDC047058]
MNRFDAGLTDFPRCPDGEFADAEELVDRAVNPALWQSPFP